MKKLFFTTLILLGFVSTLAFSAPNIAANDITSKSLGQTISNSENKCKISVEVNSFYDKDIVETELKQKVGVSEVYLDLDEKIVYVTYDNTKTNSEKLCNVINDLGYGTKVIEESNNY
jgi:copper chaperone CopZ